MGAEASPTSLSDSHSAVCWYTGKNYYESLGGEVPVGLMQASVGGSPIEYWLSSESIAKCEVDEPQCDTLEGVEKSALVATYDQSCNDLAFAENCPFKSVHNIHKQEVGARAALQLANLMQGQDLIAEGPRAQEATAALVGDDASGGFSVSVTFAGGSTPFALPPTRNCTDCCDGSFGAAAKGDFDVSVDGQAWTPGSSVRMKGAEGVVFHVAELSAPPAFVRYTAGSNFTQCALFNAEGLPALPFQIGIEQELAVVVV